MSLDAFPQKSNSAGIVAHVVQGVGAASSVTQLNGPGVTLTRTGTGLYLLTWSDPPGNFLGATWGLSATTAANIAGHTVAFGLYAAAGTMAVSVYNASDTLHDLAALEWLTVVSFFSATNVNAS